MSSTMLCSRYAHACITRVEYTMYPSWATSPQSLYYLSLTPHPTTPMRDPIAQHSLSNSRQRLRPQRILVVYSGPTHVQARPLMAGVAPHGRRGPSWQARPLMAGKAPHGR